MQFSNNDYFADIDRIDNAPFFAASERGEVDEEGNPIVSDDDLNFTPKDIGLSTKPGPTLPNLQATIKQGAGRIEFTFMPSGGKGSADNPTPESLGSRDRQDMRELLKINDIKTATHAGVHSVSLAGFSDRGFNSSARAQALKDIRKAINFAGDATRGGAVVFHMHEWQRPLSDLKGRGFNFKSYDEEDQEAVLFAVDKRTGDAVSTISKNREVYRPKYTTAEDVGLAGKTDADGNVLQPGDWVDINNKLIPRDAGTERLFDRVPKFNKDKTNFETERLSWDKLQEETDRWNAANPDKPRREPEEMFAILDFENKVLQAKGSSLYHAQQYDTLKYNRDKIKEDYDLYKKLKRETPKEEHWKIDSQFMAGRRDREGESPEDYFERAIKSAEDSMRHIHESSASADVQARQFQSVIDNVESAKMYGLKKTAETIAKAGITAMETYHKKKKENELIEPIYVAPENWHQNYYGSHPEEMREVVKAARATMVERLKGKYSKEEAENLAKTHIKATLDVGHLNTLRYNFEGSNEEFDKWLLDESEKLVKEGIVGHIHLSDNFGFDDEHVTPGQGNIPMKEFFKRMEKAGMKDIILERGSYNEHTAYFDTFAHLNTSLFGVGAHQRFARVRNSHFGYGVPGLFVAGAYAPSNDWKLWSDTPLE